MLPNDTRAISFIEFFRTATAGQTPYDWQLLVAVDGLPDVLAMNTRNRRVVKGTIVTISTPREQGYVALSHMLRAKDGVSFIVDWLRNWKTEGALGVWQCVHSPRFNCGGFATVGGQAGLNRVERVGFPGDTAKPGNTSCGPLQEGGR